MSGNRQLKVFLCHSKDDKPKVRELYHHLAADGFDAWLDEEKLMPGQDWDLEIRKAVREADVVVVCLSNSSVTKAGYVQKEIRFALDVADEQPEGVIFLIPARLEECQTPNRLSKWQWVDLFIETGYERLKKTLIYQAHKTGNLVTPSLYLQNSKARIIEPPMVRIPAGRFLMGSTEEQATQAIKDGADNRWVECEQPQHTVELSEYLIGKYPVTNREYWAFVRDSKFIPPRGWYGDQFPADKGGHPVIYVSWDDATAYCKWLSEKTGKQYRLPTEAEWEKAARGEDGRVWPWGNEFGEKNANIVKLYVGHTTPVGQFSPHGDSSFGCVDMIGNVWEWCNDWFDEKEYKNRVNQIVNDPQGPQKGQYRVLRGGSFGNVQGVARCGNRFRYFPYATYNHLGFRVVDSAIIKSEL
jgi:formylglycine-generating enzyme required for sulfatase activity